MRRLVDVAVDEGDLGLGHAGDGPRLVEELLGIVEADAAPGAQVLHRDQFLAIVAAELGDVLAGDAERLEARRLDRIEAGMAGFGEVGEQGLEVALLVLRRRLVPGLAVGRGESLAVHDQTSAAQARWMRAQASSSNSVAVA